MNDHVCRRFLFVRNWFPDKLDSEGSYQFIMDENNLNGYCTSNRCDGDLEKINAGCLFLFDAFFKDSSSFKYHNNINIVDYIMIWLSYMLNLKKNKDGTSNLQYFNKTYINSNEKYKTPITGVEGYTSYKDLIDKKHDLTKVDIKDISKFYDAFKLLCEMYTNFDENTSYCTGCSENANKFVAKHGELKNDSSITSNSSYKQLFSTLSNDYNNFKNYCTSKGGNCKDIPSLPSIETTKITADLPEQTKQIQQTVETSEQTAQGSAHSSGRFSEDPSSSSPIGNKLFTVLSIFGAIAFFLG
ncbi:BIR protein, partial [Plasmodium berghei]